MRSWLCSCLFYSCLMRSSIWWLLLCDYPMLFSMSLILRRHCLTTSKLVLRAWIEGEVPPCWGWNLWSLWGWSRKRAMSQTLILFTLPQHILTLINHWVRCYKYSSLLTTQFSFTFCSTVLSTIYFALLLPDYHSTTLSSHRSEGFSWWSSCLDELGLFWGRISTKLVTFCHTKQRC